MAKRPGKLTVLLSSEANRDLRSIWHWNVGHYDPRHADAYIDFLVTRAKRLGANDGKAVPGNPDYRYRTIRRKRKGHGHVAVFRVNGNELEVVHFFHTSQDWPNRL